MDNMNAENFTEQNIRVYEPVPKLIEGEFDYMERKNPYNMDKDI
jgi:hypothetical protein